MTEQDKTKEELIEEVKLLRKRIAELEESYGEGAQAQGQARVSKIHQSYLTKYANDLIILLDDDFRFLETNERVVDSYGYTREELLGMHATQLRASETKALFEEQIKPGRMTGKAVYETMHQRKDGTKFPVEISLRAIDVDGKRFYQAIIRDITERKKAEERLNRALKEEVKSREALIRMLADNNQIRERLERNIEELKHTQDMLIQSEKLASLGRLVSEIAHEVNNPLMIISGNAQLSLMSESASVEVKNSQRIITEECQRAKSIIERLLRFSRPSKGKVKEVNINNSIEAVAVILEHQLKLANIEVKRSYQNNLPLISIDEQQMQEVFMNLMNNAKDAMPDGGSISIITSIEGDFLRIDFKDTGFGMPEDVKRQLFEPFFTTKEKGTGLGLPVCYGIVKAHNGELIVESELNKGTAVAVRLPWRGMGNA